MTYNAGSQTNTYTTSGLLGSDSVTSVAGLATGTNYSATPYADNLSAAAGSGLSNYIVSYVNGSLTINKASLTVTGANNTVTYNSAVHTNSGASYSGQQGSDSFSISGYASGTHAGSYTDNLSVSGAALNNYVVNYRHGTLLINKALLTVTGSEKTVMYNGLVQTNSGASYTGQQGNDSFSISGYASGINANSYSDALRVSGSSLDDYTVSYTPGSLTITKANLTVTANNAVKSYDGQAYSGGNGVSYSGLLNDETNAVLGGELVYGGSSQGANKVGSFTITAAGLSSQNYAIHYVDGILTITAPVETPVVKTVTDSVFLVNTGNNSPSNGSIGGLTGANGSATGSMNYPMSSSVSSGGSVGSLTLNPLTSRLVGTSAANDTSSNTPKNESSASVQNETPITLSLVSLSLSDTKVSSLVLGANGYLVASIPDLASISSATGAILYEGSQSTQMVTLLRLSPSALNQVFKQLIRAPNAFSEGQTLFTDESGQRLRMKHL